MNDADLQIYDTDLPAGDHHVPARITRPAAWSPRPAVLLLHGLGSSKEVQQSEASSLARAGLLAVTLDAPHHGARRTPLLDQIASASGAAAHAILLRMLREAIAEIPLLVSGLLEEGHGPIGLAGVSMGAYVALGATAADPRIVVVASILGSPDWWPPHGQVDDAVRPWLDEAPSRHPERFHPRAVLLANAGRDVNVLPDAARHFAEVLRHHYRDQADRIHHVEYPESAHFMREEDWNDLWGRTVGWLGRYLAAGG